MVSSPAAGSAWPFDLDLATLRGRRSAKWTAYPADILPLHVAEMDVALAGPIAATLHNAIDAFDTGYAGDPSELVMAFTGFANRRWTWEVDAEHVRLCSDVAAGVTEVLRLLVSPGDRVVLMPPVYPPFWQWIKAAQAVPVEVPLLEPDSGGRIDLARIERALASGVRVILLCHPHNPTGSVHQVDDLRVLAGLASQHGAIVLSDEIHSPLTHAGRQFHPYLSVSQAAADSGIAFHSASKAWNLAGLKCALIVTAAPMNRAVLDGLPHEMHWSVGHLGMLSSAAAYGSGEPWLKGLVHAVERNVTTLADLVTTRLPEVRFAPPQAGFLGWLDCRRLGFGVDPATIFRNDGRVALASGSDFGAPGDGHVRLNLACAPALLDEATKRMAEVVSARR